MKKWNLHASPTQTYKKQPKIKKLKQRHFILTKSDKQYGCVVMYFVDVQKYKLPATHYHHHFYPKKYFDKNYIQPEETAEFASQVKFEI